MTPAQTQMPELPEPRAIRAGHSFPKVYALAYTADQMREYGLACVALSQQADTAQEGFQELANDTLDALRKAQMFKLATRWSKFLAAPKQADTPAQAVAPAPELTWLYTHCKAIGMDCKSDSGKWEHDIALFTINLKHELDLLRKKVAPVPAQQPEAAQWHDGNPPFAGWWDTKCRNLWTGKPHEIRLWWSGTDWRASPSSPQNSGIGQHRQWLDLPAHPKEPTA